jgi:hypothetical protein
MWRARIRIDFLCLGIVNTLGILEIMNMRLVLLLMMMVGIAGSSFGAEVGPAESPDATKSYEEYVQKAKVKKQLTELKSYLYRIRASEEAPLLSPIEGDRDSVLSSRLGLYILAGDHAALQREFARGANEEFLAKELPNCAGMYPIHLAAFTGSQYLLAIILMRYKEEISREDSKGNLPLEIVTMRRKDDRLEAKAMAYEGACDEGEEKEAPAHVVASYNETLAYQASSRYLAATHMGMLEDQRPLLRRVDEQRAMALEDLRSEEQQRKNLINRIVSLKPSDIGNAAERVKLQWAQHTYRYWSGARGRESMRVLSLYVQKCGEHAKEWMKEIRQRTNDFLNPTYSYEKKVRSFIETFGDWETGFCLYILSGDFRTASAYLNSIITNKNFVSCGSGSACLALLRTKESEEGISISPRRARRSRGGRDERAQKMRERLRKRVCSSCKNYFAEHEKSSLLNLSFVNAFSIQFAFGEANEALLCDFGKLLEKYDFSCSALDGAGNTALKPLFLKRDKGSTFRPTFSLLYREIFNAPDAEGRDGNVFQLEMLQDRREAEGRERDFAESKEGAMAKPAEEAASPAKLTRSQKQKLRRKRKTAAEKIRKAEVRAMFAEDFRLQEREERERFDKNQAEMEARRAREEERERSMAAKPAASAEPKQTKCPCCDRKLKSRVQVCCRRCGSEYYLNKSCWDAKVLNAQCDGTRGPSCLGCGGNLERH